jgi:hypothetical protein
MSQFFGNLWSKRWRGVCRLSGWLMVWSWRILSQCCASGWDPWGIPHKSLPREETHVDVHVKFLLLLLLSNFKPRKGKMSKKFSETSKYLMWWKSVVLKLLHANRNTDGRTDFSKRFVVTSHNLSVSYTKWKADHCRIENLVAYAAFIWNRKFLSGMLRKKISIFTKSTFLLKSVTKQHIKLKLYNVV